MLQICKRYLWEWDSIWKPCDFANIISSNNIRNDTCILGGAVGIVVRAHVFCVESLRLYKECIIILSIIGIITEKAMAYIVTARYDKQERSTLKNLSVIKMWKGMEDL